MSVSKSHRMVVAQTSNSFARRGREGGSVWLILLFAGATTDGIQESRISTISVDGIHDDDCCGVLCPACIIVILIYTWINAS